MLQVDVPNPVRECVTTGLSDMLLGLGGTGGLRAGARVSANISRMFKYYRNWLKLLIDTLSYGASP